MSTVEELRAARIAALEELLEMLHNQRRRVEREIDLRQVELERHKKLRDGA